MSKNTMIIPNGEYDPKVGSPGGPGGPGWAMQMQEMRGKISSMGLNNEKPKMAKPALLGPNGERRRPVAQAYDRILGGGADFNDFLFLQRRCDFGGEDWVKVCEERGDRDFTYAMEQLELGREKTACYYFLAAECMYRIGQYALNDITEEKTRLYEKLTTSTEYVARLDEPAWEKVEVPYKNYMMDGWLMTPENMPEHSPIVIYIPGATGFKEEYVMLAKNYVERGLPVLLIDGPGQGTTLYNNGGTLEIEVEKAHGAIIDWVLADGRFSDQIGLAAGSTGSYFIARTAACDRRIKACALNGGSYAPEEITEFQPAYRHKYALLYGVEDAQMDEIFLKMTLEGLAEKIECPLLICHGDKDPLFSWKGVQRIYDEACSEDKTIRIYPDGEHCCQGYGRESGIYMADWMREHLK